MSDQKLKNCTAIDSVEFVEDGILIDISEPTTTPNLYRSNRVYIKDDIMLKILSRYIDNGHENNTTNGIEDASY